MAQDVVMVVMVTGMLIHCAHAMHILPGIDRSSVPNNVNSE